jgi:hypothetical protein
MLYMLCYALRKLKIMKVKELIEKLRLCDQDAEVVMESQGSWTNIETVHISNSSKMLVELLEDTNDIEY